MTSFWAPVFFLLGCMILFGVFRGIPKGKPNRWVFGGLSIVALLLAIVSTVMSMVVVIPAGHYGVATLFGEVNQSPYKAGLHYANPLYEWALYDCRQKTHMEHANVPSQDQLMTSFDVSLQYSIDGNATPKILAQTGSAGDVLRVQIVPKLRSVLREQGKSVPNAEDFYKEDVQSRLQQALLSAMVDYLQPKGVQVTAVLMRDIQLPETIRKGVEDKKRREQEAERQKAELRRFETEQQQKVAQARAEREAAEQEAQKKRVLADAQAYEIEKVSESLAENPAYIKLEALKSLQAISKDPAAKMFFINGDSPNPLPLLHLGDDIPVKPMRGGK